MAVSIAMDLDVTCLKRSDLFTKRLFLGAVFFKVSVARAHESPTCGFGDEQCCKCVGSVAFERGD